MQVSAEYKLDSVCFLQNAGFADFDYRSAYCAFEACSWYGFGGVL